ncbi:MAG: hypothetical protein ACHRHE_22815, partial [Tepidisphaerales bacterium]
LSVNFANGYLPTINDSFTLLTAGTRNATFGSFSYPATLVTMQLSNTPTSVVVLVSRARLGGCLHHNFRRDGVDIWCSVIRTSTFVIPLLALAAAPESLSANPCPRIPVRESPSSQDDDLVS